MDSSIWLLIYILVLKINHVCVLSRCEASLSTVVNVIRCPRNKAEWDCQSKNKRCSNVPQSCVKPEEFLYHCLINEYMNMTIEVCAPSVIILGYKCAEFNKGGTIVQDNNFAKCNDSDPPCPFRYNSTDMYKYQRCYSYIKRKEEILPCFSDDISDQNIQNICSCEEKALLIVSVIFISLWLISCASIVAILHRNRNLQKRKLNRRTGDEGANDTEAKMLMQTSPETDKGEITTDRNVTPPKLPPSIKGGEITTYKDVTPPKQSPPKAEGDETITDKDANTQNKSSPESFKDNLVCSIYIGDKYCGMAYLNPDSPEDIESLGNHEIVGVLITKEGEVKEFGDNARKMFIENREDCSDYIFLDHDKLDIELGNEYISELPSMKIIDVYQSIIGFLVKKIVEKVARPSKKEGTQCKSESRILSSMHCVITVPNHWKSYVRDLRPAFDRTMKEIYKDVNEEQLHIKSREVAISPYIHEVKASVTCLNFNVDNLIFKENTAYVNLHVGSKYCNLTFLSATDPKSPDKIIGQPYRQPWKKRTPEVQFVNLLKDLFTEALFKEWKDTYYWEYISLLWQFEDQKNKMCDNLDDNEKYVFKLSSKLFKPFKEDQSKMVSLKDRLKKLGKELEMNENDCSIVFKWSFLKTFFTHVKDSTRDIIRRHRNDLKEVRCVIMTGSFSQMKLFLHEAEKVWFKELTQAVTVVIPVHIGSTYAMGAAYFFKKYPKWILYDLISK